MPALLSCFTARFAYFRHTTPVTQQHSTASAILAVAAALVLTLFAPAAAAMMHPQIGRFLQRDPLGTPLEPLGRAEANGKTHLIQSLGNVYIETTPSLSSQVGTQLTTEVRGNLNRKLALWRQNGSYQDGLSLYASLKSNPIFYLDPNGTDVWMEYGERNTFIHPTIFIGDPDGFQWAFSIQLVQSQPSNCSLCDLVSSSLAVLHARAYWAQTTYIGPSGRNKFNHIKTNAEEDARMLEEMRGLARGTHAYGIYTVWCYGNTYDAYLRIAPSGPFDGDLRSWYPDGRRP